MHLLLKECCNKVKMTIQLNDTRTASAWSDLPDLISLPDLVSQTVSRCLIWSPRPYPAAWFGLPDLISLPDLVSQTLSRCLIRSPRPYLSAWSGLPDRISLPDLVSQTVLRCLIWSPRPYLAAWSGLPDRDSLPDLVSQTVDLAEEKHQQRSAITSHQTSITTRTKIKPIFRQLFYIRL